MTTSPSTLETIHGSRWEKMSVTIFPTPRDGSIAVAQEIASLIRRKTAEGRPAVLGLATGSTPIGVYRELVRLHREEGLSFRRVLTFNLDEYYPMKEAELQSYHRFMAENLFNHVDIPRENIHLPDGTVAKADITTYCRSYEEAIARAGGLDLQLLGIGRTGHIGFNEPGSLRKSITRLITLDRLTRQDASKDFQGEDNVPRHAITMGIKTILGARQIFMLAFGDHKAPIVREAVEGEVSSSVPATFLQEHEQVYVILDQAASSELTRVKTPWLAGSLADFSLTWTDELIRKAVTWLAIRLGKPILKLTDEDYNEEGLQELLSEHGSAYEINLRVFRVTQKTITGWPGGKPNTPPTQPHHVFPKRVVVFSPHPDNDFISMGGTVLRLADQGHEVHIGYQTTGCLSVSDEAAMRFIDFGRDCAMKFGVENDGHVKLWTHLQAQIKDKVVGDIDSVEMRDLKAMIRRGEAKAAARVAHIGEECLHFLEMPFYNTGRASKNPIGEQDVALIVDLLKKIQPHQIYAAGDWADPHGTHWLCFEAFSRAWKTVRDESWAKDCEVWLYRGTWQEWPVYEIEMAVPLSPGELGRKRSAIYKYETQKDQALFLGNDRREFWQRAEERTRETAVIYDKLGLAEYEAIESFTRWKGR